MAKMYHHCLPSWTMFLLLLFSSSLTVKRCGAKTVSGDFRFTGAETEHVLTNFAVVADGSAVVRVNITSTAMYDDERALAVYLFRDDKWPKFLEASMCSIKTRYSRDRHPFTFDYVDGKWRTKEIRIVLINDDPTNPPPSSPSSSKIKTTPIRPRAHYWYVVVADCLLEQINFDKPGPRMHYNVQIFNQLPRTAGDTSRSSTPKLTHFSADEMGLYRYHTFTLIVAGAVSAWLVTTILRQVTRSSSSSSSSSSRSDSIHVTILWVTFATVLDTVSAALELAHLRLYEGNGIGSYVLDAMSAHAEAVADALAAILLWCLGAGWTLSTEVQERTLHSTTPIARLYHDWRHPFGHSGPGQALMGPGHLLMLIVLAGHVILAQWGRIYNDNFDSYHDFEHGPGRMLMWLRSTAGVLFALGTWHTHQCLQQHSAGRTLSDFYKTLLGCGVAWYAGLPALIWWVKVLPYHLKNGVVVVGSSVLQACVLASLAYLVTYSKALAKVNASATNKNHSEDVLPGSMGSSGASAPRLFSLGPAKIRLD